MQMPDVELIKIVRDIRANREHRRLPGDVRSRLAPVNGLATTVRLIYSAQSTCLPRFRFKVSLSYAKQKLREQRVTSNKLRFERFAKGQ